MNTDTATRDDRASLERRREDVMRRLMPVIDAIDRKRHAVTDAVERVIPSRAELARVPAPDRTIFIAAGALAGATVFSLAAWALRWRRERNRPIRRVARVLAAFAPRRRSPLRAVLRAIASALLTSAAEHARDLAETRVRDYLARRPEPELPEVLRVTPAPQHSPLEPPSLPTSPLTASSPLPPGVTRRIT